MNLEFNDDSGIEDEDEHARNVAAGDAWGSGGDDEGDAGAIEDDAWGSGGANGNASEGGPWGTSQSAPPVHEPARWDAGNEKSNNW